MESETRPLVSIVTAVLNAKEAVFHNLENVGSLRHLPIEHVVVDGGSTDGTLDVIERFSDAIDVFIPGPDAGISDAFNRGIQRSRGTFIAILNADDQYCCSAFEQVVSQLLDREDNQPIYYADAVQYDPTTGRSFQRSASIRHIERYMTLYHGALLVPRRIYDQLGGYDNSYKLAMDAEFVHRCVAEGERFEHLPIALTKMQLRGRSHISTSAAHAEFERSAVFHGLQTRLVARWFRMRQTLLHVLLKNRAFQGAWVVLRKFRTRRH